MTCGADVRAGMTAWPNNPDRRCHYHECVECGFIRVLGNAWSFVSEGFLPGSRTGPRVGSDEHGGREFHMANLGLQMLPATTAEVLIVGAGNSLDWKHITALPGVGKVVTSDLENFNGSPNFVALDDRGRHSYDLVIACEVVEHFTEPATDMAALCADVAPEGLAVISTNIYDGSDLARHWYVYIPGHCSYYTPDAMIRLGEQNGMLVDFRVPEVALGAGGPRKRYVLMTRSPEVMERCNRYFSAHLWAPSE